MEVGLSRHALNNQLINQSIIYLLNKKSKWHEHTHVSSEQDNKAISALTVALKTYIHIHLHIHTFIHNKLKVKWSRARIRVPVAAVKDLYLHIDTVAYVSSSSCYYFNPTSINASVFKKSCDEIALYSGLYVDIQNPMSI